MLAVNAAVQSITAMAYSLGKLPVIRPTSLLKLKESLKP